MSHGVLFHFASFVDFNLGFIQQCSDSVTPWLRFQLRLQYRAEECKPTVERFAAGSTGSSTTRKQRNGDEHSTAPRTSLSIAHQRPEACMQAAWWILASWSHTSLDDKGAAQCSDEPQALQLHPISKCLQLQPPTSAPDKLGAGG